MSKEQIKGEVDAPAPAARTREKERTFEKPVAWLLGRQLIGSLKGTLLYTAFGNKIDPRDWMEAKDDLEHTCNEDAFWFDYIADTGDGMRATYSNAYLCMSDLWIKRDNECKLPENADTKVKKERPENAETEKDFFKLPRGTFLLVGGDTTYHLADYPTLANRFQNPFKWAGQDLCEEGKLPCEEGKISDRRKIYGIPGNHDYYDLLDGFRRQFRVPVKPDEEENLTGEAEPKNAQLVIPGFKRSQKASYLAVKLPWDWWLWGLDTELGAIDDRQANFFQKLNNGQSPQKLIVATCAPTTVFGKYARWEDKKAAQTFFQLKLPWYFWSGNQKDEEMVKKIRDTLLDEMLAEMAENQYKRVKDFLDKTQTDPGKMPAGHCRLDISGDTHLYARYWGPTNESRLYSRKKSAAKPQSCDNYASVVSGGGSAFHHPSFTNVNELTEQVLYPKREDSLGAVADQIFNPYKILMGGGVYVIGFIIAFVFYFGATVPSSSSQAFDKTLDVIGNLALKVFEKAGLLNSFLSPAMFFRDNPLFCSGILLLIIPLFLLTKALFRGRRMFRLKKVKKENRNMIRQVFLWLFITVNFLAVLIGFFLIKISAFPISSFESSLLILYCLYLAVVAVVLCLHYSEWLFERARMDYITGSDWYLVFLTIFLAVIDVSAGIWFFGKNNQPVFVLTDILFVLVVVLTPMALVLGAYYKGGEMREGKGKLSLLWCGFWHAVLQISVPFILVKNGSLLSLIFVAMISFAAVKLAILAMKRQSKTGLNALWILYGAAILFLPLWTLKIPFLPPWLISRLPQPPPGEDGFGLYGFGGAILAGICGAVFSCIWFGWYLAVCFLNYHGHNNEVGGAVRIEGYKQFIRFKVTKDYITGYVIGVDKVDMIGEQDKNGNKIDGKSLNPKLIDVFTLAVK